MLAIVDADWGRALGGDWWADASKLLCVRHVPGTNGNVRLGSERKFSSGTWKIFVILPRALAIDDDFKNRPWLKFRTFLASAN
jgi:hypothetical protein